MSNQDLSYAIVGITEYARDTAIRLKNLLNQENCRVYTLPRYANEIAEPLTNGTVVEVRRIFTEVDVLICIMAAGAVVRAVGPVLGDKTTDPAVLVMDEKAKNVVSLLSGHIGGANDITYRIAGLLGANPVVTTATDTQNVTALDNLAKTVNAWSDDIRHESKIINGYLAAHKPVYFYQEKPWIEDKRGLTEIDASEVETYLHSDKPFIYLTTTPQTYNREDLAIVYPKPYLLGVGARRNVATDVFETGFLEFCQMHNVDPREIGLIASVDIKADEQCIIDLAAKLDVPFVTYTAEQLATVADKYPRSQRVVDAVGIGAVSAPSADLASNGHVLTERFARQGCTYVLGKYKKYKG